MPIIARAQSALEPFYRSRFLPIIIIKRREAKPAFADDGFGRDDIFLPVTFAEVGSFWERKTLQDGKLALAEQSGEEKGWQF